MVVQDLCRALTLQQCLYTIWQVAIHSCTPYTLQHSSPFIQICNLVRRLSFSPKKTKQLHLDMGNLASQGLANCGRVAKSVGEASCTLLAIHGSTTGAVADWYTT